VVPPAPVEIEKDPPREQLLAGVGILIGDRVLDPPPHEQWLVAVGVQQGPGWESKNDDETKSSSR
jgi:hypothetical protein